uniref:Uncharacterized protein n=1 Tax=Avena sativa TaxID=4498 RepID=A0ACD5Y4H0_AVESA
MPLPRDSNGDTAAGAPSLASYHAPLAEPLLDNPRRSDWFGFCRGGPTASAPGGVAVDWGSVRSTCREWMMRHPMNIALLLWLLCVGASGGMLALLLLGLLDGAFPAPAARSHWVEVDNQVLNALFTLMSLYQHPALFHHLFLLCRRRLPADAAELRAAYCGSGSKGGGPGPDPARTDERAHMAVVVVLLHITVVCQYALCWLYWCFTERSRPELAEDVFCAVGVAAPVVAVVYTVCSPLGRDPSGDLDAPSVTEQFPKMSAHADTEVVVVEPEWAGGMFDCAGGGGETAAGCCLSLSCTFCVFGWNAERLGFGNACVHATTFLLHCFAPLWVLGVTALRVHDAAVGDVVVGAGVLLCAGGLLYGGYWRIQMRRKFGLPGSAACCGSKSATDYARWLSVGRALWLRRCARRAGTISTARASSTGRTLPPANTSRCYSRVTVPIQPLRTAPLRLRRQSMTDHQVSTWWWLFMMRWFNHRWFRLLWCETMTHARKAMSFMLRKRSPAPKSAIDVEEEDGPSLLASNREEPEDQRLSRGRWRVEKLKRMINVVTMVWLLFLLYTRGFIR